MSMGSEKTYYKPRTDPVYPFSNRPLITWDIEYASLNTLEFPTNVLRRLVPPELELMEARPGVGLAVITLFHYAPWQQRRYPDLFETIFMVQVVPDLRWGIPNLAVFVASFGSNDREFLADEREFNLFPTFDSSLQFHLSEDHGLIRCFDETGPVYDLSYVGRRKPIYTHQDIYCQVYVENNGHLHVSHNTFSGMLYQHQEQGDGGTLHRHPFFLGADVSECECTPYLQMVTKPGSRLRQMYYWRPERIDQLDQYEPLVDLRKLTEEQAELLRQFRKVDHIPRGLRMPVPS